MIRLWFRALARKFLSGRLLEQTSRPRRQGVRPRLEALEERTVASTLNVEPPGLLPPTPRAGTTAVDAPVKPGSIDPAPADADAAGGPDGSDKKAIDVPPPAPD